MLPSYQNILSTRSIWNFSDFQLQNSQIRTQNISFEKGRDSKSNSIICFPKFANYTVDN